MAALSRFLLLIAALTLGGKAMAADLENTCLLYTSDAADE